MTAPTGSDAIRRRLATYPTRDGGRAIGRVICVRNGRAKLRLPSGAHVTVRAADVHVLAAPPTPPRVLP